MHVPCRALNYLYKCYGNLRRFERQSTLQFHLHHWLLGWNGCLQNLPNNPFLVFQLNRWTYTRVVYKSTKQVGLFTAHSSLAQLKTYFVDFGICSPSSLSECYIFLQGIWGHEMSKNATWECVKMPLLRKMSVPSLCRSAVGKNLCVLWSCENVSFALSDTLQTSFPSFIMPLFIPLYRNAHILPDCIACSCPCNLCRFNYTLF